MDATLIKAVIATLNGIEVKGKKNLDALLGCINALESVAQVLERQPTQESEETNRAKE